MEGMRAPFQGHLNVLVAIPTRTYKHKQHGPRSTRIYVSGLAFKSNCKIGGIRADLVNRELDLVKRRSSPI